MKPAKKLFLILSLLIVMTSCILPSGIYDLFYPVLANFPGLAEEEPDKGGGDDISPEGRPTQYWNCSGSDLSSYLGEDWQAYQVLDLEMSTVNNALEFSATFKRESEFIVKRDPDYRPPPGATLVPEGSYDVDESYSGFGKAELDGKVYRGAINVDYTIITNFPEPVVNQGELAFRTVGHYVSEDILEICLDVYEGGYEDAVNDPFNQLAPNCRWPGYIFSCTPAP